MRLLSFNFESVVYLRDHIPTLFQNKFLKALIQKDEQSIIEVYEDENCPEELIKGYGSIWFYNNPEYFEYFEKSSKYQLNLLENPQHFEERLQFIAKHCAIVSPKVYEKIVSYYNNHDKLPELFYKLFYSMGDLDEDKEKNERIIDRIVALQKRFPENDKLIASIVSCFTHEFIEDTFYSIFRQYMKNKLKIKIEWI